MKRLLVPIDVGVIEENIGQIRRRFQVVNVPSDVGVGEVNIGQVR